MDRIRIAALVLFALAVAGPALADDFHPPAWRGAVGSLTAEWEFGDSANPKTPDGALTNMTGASGTQTTKVDVYSASWRSGDGDGEWYWGDSRDSIIGVMDNLDTLDDEMEILIQLAGSWTTAPEMVWVRGYDVAKGWDMNAQMLDSGSNSTQAWWLYSLSNCDFEKFGINIARGSVLDQVVVDTLVGTPEPATLALLVLGGTVGLLRRRRAA